MNLPLDPEAMAAYDPNGSPRVAPATAALRQFVESIGTSQQAGASAAAADNPSVKERLRDLGSAISVP